jgi:hypothetical protein
MLQWPGSLQPGFKSPSLPKVVKISSYIQIFAYLQIVHVA